MPKSHNPLEWCDLLQTRPNCRLAVIAAKLVQPLGFAHPVGHVPYFRWPLRQTAAFSTLNLQIWSKNENVPDPGLSLGTFVEQPSPRTAQNQSRFLPRKRKWPCRASGSAPAEAAAIEGAGRYLRLEDCQSNVAKKPRPKAARRRSGANAVDNLRPHISQLLSWGAPDRTTGFIVSPESGLAGKRRSCVGLPTLVEMPNV